MAKQTYRIVFSGQLVAGADPARTRAGLQKLFKADDARIEALFSGRRVVIKKSLDAETADKYRGMLAKAGARCEVEPEAAPEPAAAGEPELTLAEPGADLREGRPPRPRPERPDAGDLTLAPVGADMVEKGEKPVPFEPDLSDLSMAPPGSDLGPGKKD